MGNCLAVPVSPRRGGTWVNGDWQPSGVMTVSEAAPASPGFLAASPYSGVSRVSGSPYKGSSTNSPLQEHGIRHSQQLRRSQHWGARTPGGEAPDCGAPGSGRRRQSAIDPFADLPGEPEVDETPKSWTRGELIGEGAFGSVYSGLDNDTGRLMAVKQVRVPRAAAVKGKVAVHLSGLEADINVLRRLKHPNIVRYLGSERQDDFIHIFLEFVPGGSIAQLLTRFGALCEAVVRVYTRDILMGLAYLHQHRIMHRDIKGANLLVASSGRIKLADFGASRKIEELASCDSNIAKSLRGTAYWMAPEVIKQDGHGRAADIWSVGCTIIEMVTGKPPWTQYDNQVSAMYHIAQAIGGPPLPDCLSHEGRDFLRLCFNRNPKARATAAELLRHPFLQPVAPAIPRSPGGSVASTTAATSPAVHRAEALSPLQLPQDQLTGGPSLFVPNQAPGAPVSPIPEETEEWMHSMKSGISTSPPKSNVSPSPASGSLVDSLRATLAVPATPAAASAPPLPNTQRQLPQPQQRSPRNASPMQQGLGSPLQQGLLQHTLSPSPRMSPQQQTHPQPSPQQPCRQQTPPHKQHQTPPQASPQWQEQQLQQGLVSERVSSPPPMIDLDSVHSVKSCTEPLPATGAPQASSGLSDIPGSIKMQLPAAQQDQQEGQQEQQQQQHGEQQQQQQQPAVAAEGAEAPAVEFVPPTPPQPRPPGSLGPRAHPLADETDSIADNPFEEFNPMEDPEPRWDAGTCNNHAQAEPASPSKPMFARVDTAGLSCMSPGPRLHGPAEALCHEDAASEDGGSPRALHFAPTQLPPPAVAESLQQGMAIQDWVARASAAAVKHASQPFVHDDGAQRLAAALSAAGSGDLPQHPAPGAKAERQSGIGATVAALGAALSINKQQQPGAEQPAAAHAAASVAASVAADIAAPEAPGAEAAAAEAAAVEDDQVDYLSASSGSHSGLDDGGLIYEQEQASPNVQPGTASSDRRQWGDLRRSSGSMSSGGGGRKQEAVTPQKQQTVARSQTLPRGERGGGGGGYATGSPGGKASPAKPLKSALRSSSSIGALSRSTSLPPRRIAGSATAMVAATAAGSSSTGHGGTHGGGGLNPKPRAPGYADMPSPVQRQKSAGRTQRSASPAARRRGAAVSRSLSSLPTSQPARAGNGSARGDGESAAQAVASMLQRVASKK